MIFRTSLALDDHLQKDETEKKRMIGIFLNTFFFSILILLASIVVCRLYAAFCRRNSRSCKVAFFHPYCNSCGGGERVLWLCISAMQSSSNLPFVANSASARYLIYTGDSDAQPTEILEKAKV
jgi:alpha-1,2-mannosyltransferase